MNLNKPNIVRVERDERVLGGGHFYKVFFDRRLEHEYVTFDTGENYTYENYTYLLATDELDAWGLVQRMLDVQYGND